LNLKENGGDLLNLVFQDKQNEQDYSNSPALLF